MGLAGGKRGAKREMEVKWRHAGKLCSRIVQQLFFDDPFMNRKEHNALF
jgi:hypothetical protein